MPRAKVSAPPSSAVGYPPEHTLPPIQFDTVEALQLGYYGDQLRKEGSRFSVKHGETSLWWKKVS